MEYKLEKVSAGYERNHFILQDLSLTIGKGGVWGILGPNGSGKSTLLRVLSGTLPYNGSLTLEGKELSRWARKALGQAVSMMPQFSSVYFSYTVYDTVLMGRYAHQKNTLSGMLGGASASDKAAVEKALERTGIRSLSGELLSRLSGGQLQRVLLARTMAQETPVILLDEPTNHLDLKYQQALLQDLAAWAKESTSLDGISHPNTVIAVFHDIAGAAMIADHILLMKEGAIMKKGPARETLKQSLLQSIYDTDVIAYYDAVQERLEKLR